MNKQEAKQSLTAAANTLGIAGDNNWKNQQAHVLLTARTVLDAAGVKDDKARAAGYNALREVGHGLGCNASQFAQWAEKPDGQVASNIVKSLKV